MATTGRLEYVAGLRALADLLEAHDELPAPYIVNAQWIVTSSSEDDQRRIVQTFARVIPGTVRKSVRDTYFDLDGKVGPVEVGLIAGRDSVCTRRVVAVREVTEEVPDPDALKAVPTVTVTKTVEDVEWDCHPILTDREQQMIEAANDGFIDNYDPAIDAPGADDYLADAL